MSWFEITESVSQPKAICGRWSSVMGAGMLRAAYYVPPQVSLADELGMIGGAPTSHTVGQDVNPPDTTRCHQHKVCNRTGTHTYTCSLIMPSQCPHPDVPCEQQGSALVWCMVGVPVFVGSGERPCLPSSWRYPASHLASPPLPPRAVWPAAAAQHQTR